MANLQKTIYERISRLHDLALSAQGANYESDADMGEQAGRLEEIAEIADEVAPILRDIDAALGADEE